MADRKDLPRRSGSTSSLEGEVARLVGRDELVVAGELEVAGVGRVRADEDAGVGLRARSNEVGRRGGGNDPLARGGGLDLEVAGRVLGEVGAADGLAAGVGSGADEEELVGEGVSRACSCSLLVYLL